MVMATATQRMWRQPRCTWPRALSITPPHLHPAFITPLQRCITRRHLAITTVKAIATTVTIATMVAVTGAD